MCTMSAVSVALVVPFGCAQGAVTARGDVKEPPISRLASFSGAHVNSYPIGEVSARATSLAHRTALRGAESAESSQAGTRTGH